MHVLALGLTLLSQSVSPALPSINVIIVANNTSDEPDTRPLRYADDDAAKYYELFSLIADRVELLAVLDADTQRVYPQIVERARIPSRRNLELSLANTFEAMTRAEQEGRRTVFYFIYMGHGAIAGSGEGSMFLSDARFTRADLFQQVISRSPASVNHVIIDACNAYFMVAKRGADDMDAAVRDFLANEDLARYPNTGVLVSTSKAQDVHEWSRVEAGVFSHQVRSAFAGAADVDGDKKVTYDEVRGFLAAANGKVRDPKAKLDAFARAPDINHAEAIFDRARSLATNTVRVPGVLSGHRWLVDDRGVRYADFNVASDGPISLLLLPARSYVLAHEEGEVRLPTEAMTEVDAGALQTQPRTVDSRSAEDVAYRRDLFAIPFGRSYLEGYRASLVAAPQMVVPGRVETGGPRAWAAIGFGAGGVAALGTGIAFGLVANDRAEQYRGLIGTEQELDGLRRSSRSASRAANVLYAVGAASFLAAGAIWLWP